MYIQGQKPRCSGGLNWYLVYPIDVWVDTYQLALFLSCIVRRKKSIFNWWRTLVKPKQDLVLWQHLIIQKHIRLWVIWKIQLLGIGNQNYVRSRNTMQVLVFCHDYSQAYNVTVSNKGSLVVMSRVLATSIYNGYSSKVSHCKPYCLLVFKTILFQQLISYIPSYWQLVVPNSYMYMDILGSRTSQIG